MATTPPCSALARWQAQYPNPAASAEQNAESRADEERRLAPFAGLDALDREQVKALVGWKFQSMAHRRARALSGITPERWERQHGEAGAARIIRAALAAPGDDQPLMILAARNGIYGFGPAMGSVILAACRPQQFTIADTRSLRSLRALGLMSAGPKWFRLRDWERYLEVCRELAQSCRMSLREVDQALWVAAGDAALPDIR
jgi:hypothetical protein